MGLLQNIVFWPKQKNYVSKKLVRTATSAVLTNFFFGLFFQNLILQQTHSFLSARLCAISTVFANQKVCRFERTDFEIGADFISFIPPCILPAYKDPSNPNGTNKKYTIDTQTRNHHNHNRSPPLHDIGDCFPIRQSSSPALKL